jgi:PAS domain S-box-containing protein
MTRRRRLRWGESAVAVACVSILIVSLVGALAAPDDVFPAVFPIVAAFVAATLASLRLTVVIASLAVVQFTLVALWSDSRTGWPLVWRTVFVVVSAGLAVVLAVLRRRRDRELVQIRGDLQESSLLRTLAATSRDPIYLKDRKGQYLLANDATARALGRALGEDLRGRRDRELLDGDVADTIEAEDQQVFRSGTVQEFEDVLEVDGEPHIYLTHKAPLLDDHGFVVGLTAVAKDITIRRNALTRLEDSEHRLARLSASRQLVAEVASRVAVASDPERIAGEALAVLRDHLPRHSGAVVLSEPDDPSAWRSLAFTGVRPDLAARWHDTIPDIHTPSYDVVTSGAGMSFAGPADYKRAYPDLAADIDAAGVGGPTFLEPLAAGTRILGVLSLSFHEPLTEPDASSTCDTLRELAPVIGHSLRQAQFLELEGRIARSFQEAMLELDEPVDSRIMLATTYQAGSQLLEAGGDWYDIVPLADGRIALMVGDVVGRSLRAATVMGRLRAAMRALVLTLADPAQVLSRLDDLVETIEDASFATCLCAFIDPARGTLAYASAGHPPAVVIAPRGTIELLEDVQGGPLGVRGRRPRRNGRRDIEVGSRLVLYTDGLVERRREPLDAGLTRLVDAVRASRHAPVDQLPGLLIDVLFADYEQRDDVAMICAEVVSESPAHFHRRLDADPTELRSARRALAHWVMPASTGDGAAVSQETASDVVLAVSEALANAIEHGGGGPQSIDLDVSRDGGMLHAVVRDRGAWRPSSDDPVRGRGLQIMRRLAEDLAVETDDDGTTVTLTLTLRSPS